MSRLCVFCGSRPGADARFVSAATRFGALLVENGCSLVYGGGATGMMGAVADSVLGAGGEVIGVVPKGLFGEEHLHPQLSRTILVESMSERKNVMSDLSQGFVVLPGGLGTMDELFELWANRQLDLHPHPIGLLNTIGYYDALVAFLQGAVASDYVSAGHLELLKVETEPEPLLHRLLHDR